MQAESLHIVLKRLTGRGENMGKCKGKGKGGRK
jgi:hypothetical protein